MASPTATPRVHRALPGAALTVVRLHASRNQLAERISCRVNGEGPQLPGDRLLGRDVTELARIADQAANDAAWLTDARIGDYVVDTDGRWTRSLDTVHRHIGDWPRPKPSGWHRFSAEAPARLSGSNDASLPGVR
jgi:hypothetical protein